ncbi:MAG: FimB/Mfa2 family fimbrial subunit [Phocaeicola plebeius]|nr:FimB/Mfa2 family fimbrial subunit [Phocaeicola plebeius]
MKRMLPYYYYLIGMMAWAVTACTPYQLTEEESETEQTPVTPPSTEQGELALLVRSTDNTPLNLPITVFLFDEQQCIHQTRLESPQDTYQFQTVQGNYHLTAFAGLTDDYQLPEGYTYESFIQLPENPASVTPLMAGRTDVQLSKSTHLTVQLGNVMTMLQTTLTQVPQDATQVVLEVSPVSSAYSFSGKYKNDQKTCRIACHKTSDGWTAPTTYLLPTASTYTLLTVQVTTPKGIDTQSYSLPHALKAGQPYQLKGSLIENKMTLEGTFSIAGWEPANEIEFIFDGSNTNPTDSPDTTFTVTRLPEAGDIWNGCYVWETEDTEEGERELLLLSPTEFSCQAAQGLEQLSGYLLNGIGNWRTFTKDEAKRFREQFGDTMTTLESLNALLTAHNMTIIHAKEDDRYLCENCTYSFTMCPTKNYSNTKVGSQKTYCLRGLKWVSVRLEP